MAGPRDAPCLLATPAPPRMAAVLRCLHALMRREGRQPAIVQTDRGARFLGSEGGTTAALPGRLTLWLWGHGIAHRLLPSGHPQGNGAVERWNGAVVHSWLGEAGGLDDLRAVWNRGKATPPAPPTPYQGRAGWRWERVWQGLAGVRVERKADRQGKLSVWDRPARVGRRGADRTVVVTFDAEQRLAVLRDEHGSLLKDLPLPWLTPDWVWTGVEGADDPLDAGGTSTFR